MADSRVFVHASAALGPAGDTVLAERVTLTGDPAPADLRDLVRRTLGAPLRQASHFVELAAIASQLCLKRLHAPAPENTAVYLGTGLAEVRKTRTLFEQVMPPGPGMASPFDFINAANNMAAFYVARLGGLRSRNLTLSQEEFSFEWALRLAWEDLRAGLFRQALVGGLDESSQPRAQHLRRMHLQEDQVIGEGAGFFYLSVEPAPVELLGVRFLREQPVAAGLSTVLEEWQEPLEPVELLPGFRLTAEDRSALARHLPAANVTEYLHQCGCFHTAAAFGLARTLESGKDSRRLVLHLNRKGHDQWMVVGIRIRSN